MNYIKLFALWSLLALPCFAQGPAGNPEPPIDGSFYVSVDDFCTIFVNGVQVYHSDIGESRSPATVLKVGDRVVVQLVNKKGPRRFMMAFASTDGRKVISFKHENFKIVPDLDVTDFKPLDASKWATAKEEKHGKFRLPIKSGSDWIWGDLDKCIIGGVITSQMVAFRNN